MPWASQEQNTQFIQPFAVGPVMQTTPIIPTPPTTIAATSSWSSGVLPSDGYKALAIGVTSTQAGAIDVTRYIDAAGTIALDNPALTKALLASTAAVLTVTDGLPFASFVVTVTNTSASAATVTGFGILMNAA